MFHFGGFTDSPHPHKQETRGLDTIQATSFFPWWLLKSEIRKICHGGAVVSAVASQQEGPGFESRPFCVELACSPRVCVGFLRVLRFPPTSKDMHSILLSLPRDQGTGIRTGVGPRALHCGCPLFLTSLGWVKCRGQISPPGLIKYDLWFIYLWFI